MSDLGLKKFLFESMCELDNKYWFFTNVGNHLCSMRKECDMIEFVGINPFEEMDYNYLYTALIPYKKKIYLIPRAAKYIGVYDVEKHEFGKIDLRKANGDMPILYNDSLKFSSAVFANNRIYLLPRKYPAIVEINLDSDELVYHTDWIKQYEEVLLFDGEYFLYDYTVYEGKIYVPASSASGFIIIDTEQDIIKFVQTSKGTCYSGIEICGTNLYMARSSTGDIEIWDVDKIVYKDLIHIEHGKVMGAIAYGWMTQIDIGIVLIPFWYSDILIMGENGKIVQKYSIDRNNGESQIAVCCKWISGGCLYVLDNISYRILVFDEQGQLVNEAKPAMSKKMWKTVLEKRVASSGLLFENGETTLDDLINLLTT